MDKIKNISCKLTEYLENKKIEEAHLHELEEMVRKKTQAQYINQTFKGKGKNKLKNRGKKHRATPKVVINNTFINKIHKVKEVIHNVNILEKIELKKLSVFKYLNINNIFKRFTKTKKILNPNIEKTQFRVKNERKAYKKYVIFGTSGILILMISFVYLIDSITAYEVTFNGQDIGIVKDPQSVMALVGVIDEKLDGEYNADIIIKSEKIQFTKVRGFGMELSKEKDILDHFSYISNFEAKGYAIDIEGDQIAVFSKKEEAESFLEELKSVYVHEDENTKYDNIYFLENVAINETETAISAFSNYEESFKYVIKGTNEEKLYKVKKGENYWTIAEKYNIKPEDLEVANPNVKPEKLQIGQEISLIVPKPLVTVVTVEKQTYYEKIPFEMSYENTSALYKGENEIKLRGKNGKKEILAEVEKQNGIEVSKTEIESKVIENPKTQIVLVGTKALPPLIGTGSFDNPTRGTLTSKFGSRWGRMHSGIDIAGPVGTAIRASDGGVVTYTGWKGNYGLTVIINHGQNKSTLYAHTSKILVKKGDKIYKGQKIAEMGSTGKSTGPHLHFEVQVNGAAKNPLNYVSY